MPRSFPAPRPASSAARRTDGSALMRAARCRAERDCVPQCSSGSSTASAPQSCRTSKNTSGLVSPSARCISRHTRSGTRALISPCSTMRRISSPVSGATREAERGQARGKSGHAQHAHRVLDKGRRHMAQQALLEIAPAAVGVDQRAVQRARHRIDGQIATLQILLERHLGRELRLEAAVAGPGLALQARERVFLIGVRDAGTPGIRVRPARYPARCSSSGVAPTTTQSRSGTGRPSSSSRTAPPTRYTCMAAHVNREPQPLTALKTPHCWRPLLIGATLPGCAIGYLTQAAQGQWRLMRARRPIEQVIADPQRQRAAQGAAARGAGRARFRQQRPRAAGQPQLSQLQRPEASLRGLECGGSAGVFGRAAALVLPVHRLPELSRLFPRGRRAQHLPRRWPRAATT